LAVLALGWIPLRWLYIVLATAALAVGLYGLALLARRSAIGFALVFYAMILAVWPYPPDRFIWVVLPWLALTWTVGAVELWRRWPRVRIPIALLCALVVGGYLHYELQGFKGRWWDAQARAISANFAELLPVVQNLPDSAVLATDDEPPRLALQPPLVRPVLSREPSRPRVDQADAGRASCVSRADGRDACLAGERNVTVGDRAERLDRSLIRRCLPPSTAGPMDAGSSP